MTQTPGREPGTTGASDPTRTFAELATIIYGASGFDEIYTAICHAATRLVTGCDHACLTLLSHGQPVTAAASDDTAAHIDRLEREIGDGPCLDAIEDDTAYIDSDLTDGSPWPELSRRALAETSVRGMAGFRLLADGRKQGALNLFSDTPGALTERSVDEAIMLVSFTSVALSAAQSAQAVESLKQGLQTNREIGKAVGLMMAFHKVSDDEAFEMLRQTSQDMNIKVLEVAREIVRHHNARNDRQLPG